MKLFFVYSYVCNDPEFETAYEQAPKTGLKQNISQGKERDSLIMFSLQGSPEEIVTMGPLVRFQGASLLSSEILKYFV